MIATSRSDLSPRAPRDRLRAGKTSLRDSEHFSLLTKSVCGIDSGPMVLARQCPVAAGSGGGGRGCE